MINGESVLGSPMVMRLTSRLWITTEGRMNMANGGLPPIHPGEFLKESLEELSLSQAEFARAIGASSMRISHIVNGSRPVTAELALLFGRAFNQSPRYWLNLQLAYDLTIAQRAFRARLRGVRSLVPA